MSQSRSRTEYLISMDNIIVLDRYFKLTKNPNLFAGLSYDLIRFFDFFL